MGGTKTGNSPESLLSNWAADALLQIAPSYTELPIDMALLNIGGLRNSLPQGDVTYGAVFEVFPFENTLCVLTLSGEQLQTLFEQIAARGGEAIAGASMVIDENSLVSAKVGDEPIDKNRTYVIATVDYLAEGNDGMPVLAEAQSYIYPNDATLRQLMLDYVSAQTRQGKPLASRLDGRIRVIK